MNDRPETRRFDRAPLSLEVHYRTQGSFLVSYSVNLSKGGLFLETQDLLPVGTELTVRFAIPGAEQPVETMGKVMWVRRATSDDGLPPGLGLQFDRLEESIGKIIDRLVQDFTGVQLMALADDQAALHRLTRYLQSILTCKVVQAAAAEVATLERVMDELNAGRGAREAGEDEDTIGYLRRLGLLTSKPILYAANVGENDLAAGGGERVRQLRDAVRAHHEEALVVPFSARIEEELTDLDPGERREYLDSVGVEEPGLDRLIHAGYRLLGLETFFTVGENEVRAWTIPRGSTAFEAAGEIHTDFQRGFIRAETIAVEEFIAAGSYRVARERGLMRSEGRDYAVKDGDVLLFRFNV